MEEQYLKQYFGFGPSECIFHTFFFKASSYCQTTINKCLSYYLGFFFCLFLKEGYEFIWSSYFPHGSMNSQS